MMNITLKRTGLILLLATCFAGTTTAFAQSRFQDNSFGFFAQNDGRQRSNHDRRGGDERRQSGERGDRGDRGSQQRRDDRLSPDERRALRQQIDEAGRDIYAPRRR